MGRKPVIALGAKSCRLSGMTIPLTLDLNQATFFLAIGSLGFNISNLSNPTMQALRADIVIIPAFNLPMACTDLANPTLEADRLLKYGLSLPNHPSFGTTVNT